MLRRFICSVVIAAVAGLGAAQTAGPGVGQTAGPGAGQTAERGDASEAVPTIRVTTRLVVLDVVVSDGHGHAGAGLKASDFQLTEDGVPQTIESFTERDVPAPVAEGAGAALPPNTFTVQPPVKSDGAVTVIVVNYSVRWHDFIHTELEEYFRANPTTPTAIFRMDGGLHLIQGLTADRTLLESAAASKRFWPPLGPRFHSDPASFHVRAIGSPTRQLAKYLSGISGRINVIWVGGVAPSRSLDQDMPDESSRMTNVTEMVGSLNRMTDVHRVSPIALYNITLGLCGGGPPASTELHMGGGPPIRDADGHPIVATIADAERAFAVVDLQDSIASTGGRNFNCTFPKEALKAIAATDSHYYTISYRSTNGDWNGAFRRIHLDVTGFVQPPFTMRWSQLITGWADDVEPTLMYRRGYFARVAPGGDAGKMQAGMAATQDGAVGGDAHAGPGPRRKLISVSPKGDMGPNEAQIEAATAFGSRTPTDMRFTIVVRPGTEIETIKGQEELPAGNFLTTPFRDGPYRNFRIHYWVDPQELHLVQNALGRYEDDLRAIVVVYRDDGVTANSISTRTHLDVSAADAEALMSSGFSLDQYVAVPTTENFFLRAAVAEQTSGHIGAIEVPVEWVKLEPAEETAGH